MARLPLISDELKAGTDRSMFETTYSEETLPEEYRNLIDHPERNIYLTLGHNMDLLEAGNDSISILWNDILEERERELTILTVARELKSTYEWHQHTRIGLGIGLTPHEIRSISSFNLGEFSDREQSLIQYARAMARMEVTDEDHERLAEYVDEETQVGIVSLVGRYISTAHKLHALDVETEEPFIGWQLERLK